MIVALRANDSSRKREMKVNFRFAEIFLLIFREADYHSREARLSFLRSKIIIPPKADLSQFHLIRKLKTRQPSLSGFYL